MNKLDLQLLLLRVEQQHEWLPDSQTLRIMLRRISVINSEDDCQELLPSQLRHYVSRRYSRDDAERHSQPWSSLPVRKWTTTLPSSCWTSSRWISKYQAELTQKLERIKNRKRTSFDPEITRLQAQLLTRVSALGNKETELQRTIAESASRKSSAQCPHKSKSDYKQFAEN